MFDECGASTGAQKVRSRGISSMQKSACHFYPSISQGDSTQGVLLMHITDDSRASRGAQEDLREGILRLHSTDKCCASPGAQDYWEVGISKLQVTDECGASPVTF